MGNVKNSYGYEVGTYIDVPNEKGFVVVDMFNVVEKDAYLRPYLKCKCLECGLVENVRASDLHNGRKTLTHQKCGKNHKGIDENTYKRNNGAPFYNEHVNGKFHSKIKTSYNSMKDRCATQNSYINNGIGYNEEFAGKDGSKNWRNYLEPMLIQRIDEGLASGEFVDVLDALGKLSVDRIDNNGNYAYGNLRWTTADVQTQNRNCMSSFYAIAPDNTCYVSNNKTRFAEAMDLSVSDVKRKTTSLSPQYTKNGWVFEKADPLFKFDFENPDSKVVDKNW